MRRCGCTLPEVWSARPVGPYSSRSHRPERHKRTKGLYPQVRMDAPKLKYCDYVIASIASTISQATFV